MEVELWILLALFNAVNGIVAYANRKTAYPRMRYLTIAMAVIATPLSLFNAIIRL